MPRKRIAVIDTQTINLVSQVKYFSIFIDSLLNFQPCHRSLRIYSFSNDSVYDMPIKKMLVTFHEQQRILQFNNQNLHVAKIIHIINNCNI